MEPAVTTKNHIWYPDEEICKRRRNIPDWIRQQRKVAKKANDANIVTYFTIAMLKVPFRVTKKVSGLDPNKPEQAQLRRWRKEYKGVCKRQTSEALREKKRKMASVARKARNFPRVSKRVGT
jgi:hypothetical protein